MLEIKVTVEAKELAQSIGQLAAALSGLVIPRPEGMNAQPVGVHDTTGKPTDISAAATAESVPSQPMNAQNSVDQIPVAQGQAQSGNAARVMNPSVTAAAPVIDLETISRAGAALIDQGKTKDVLALLAKFGVPAVNLLDPSQYPAFAEGLKALGSNI